MKASDAGKTIVDIRSRPWFPRSLAKNPPFDEVERSRDTGHMIGPNVLWKGITASVCDRLAIEWNALAPAYFPTEMTTAPRIGTVPPEHEAVIKQFTPMQRLGRVEEIDTAVLFLASPASSELTGSVVTVDGGRTAW